MGFLNALNKSVFDSYSQLEKGIVEGSYGSCSGCDSFLAEFNYTEIPTLSDGKFYRSEMTWDETEECTEEEYNKLLLQYEDRLLNFGMSYLDSLYGKDHYKNRLSQLDKDDWFDEETKEYCQWAINQFEKLGL
jgi:hypothetical protein